MEIHQQPRKSGFDEFAVREGALRKLTREVGCAPARYASPPSVFEAEALPRVPEPAQAAVKMLLDSIIGSVVHPALRAPNHEAWFKSVRDRWHDFFETMQALHVLLARVASEERAAVVTGELAQLGIEALVRAARQVSGGEAADEARFCAETYARALRLAPELDSVRPQSAEALEEDRGYAQRFATAAIMHLFGVLSIHEARSGAEASPAGIRGAFEMLRAGALDCYVAGRCAMELRRNAEDDDGDDGNPYPSDAEDNSLATIGDD